MERTPREVWKKRVERWQASDLTAKEFAEEIGVNPGTLSHWKWQLGWEARGKPSAKAKSSKAKPKRRATARRRTKKERVNFTEVAVTSAPAPTPIEIVTDSGVRIRVSEQFDDGTLRRVLEVVQGRA